MKEEEKLKVYGKRMKGRGKKEERRYRRQE